MTGASAADVSSTLREQPSRFNLYGKYGAKYSQRNLAVVIDGTTEEAHSIYPSTSRAVLTKGVGQSRHDIFIDERSNDQAPATESFQGSRTYLNKQNSSEQLQDGSLPFMLSGNHLEE